jgi:hypothetical protein
MSLIESLIGSGIKRPDEKRLLPPVRPLPVRPRELFEIIVSLAREATMKSLVLSIDLRNAEPRGLTYLVLNRWPTSAELAAIPAPYRPREHLRELLSGQEFRACLMRRLFEAYPERPRQFFVAIPRCATTHFIRTVREMHPIAPPGLARWQPKDENRFMPILGEMLGMFPLTRTIMTYQPTLAPFVQAVQPPVPTPSHADTGFQWTVNPPPRRVGDRLFTIVREPTGLILSHVNATLDRLLTPADHPAQEAATWRPRLAHLPPPTTPAARKTHAREILRHLPIRNPICTALADGTAAGAFQAARLQDIEIADLAHYDDWIKYTWDVEPEPPTQKSTPHLTKADLTPEDQAHLQTLIGEDLVFYEPIAKGIPELGERRHAVRGREL